MRATLANILPVARASGVTRLADVTGLWQRKQQGPSLVLRPTDRESAEYRVEVEGSAPRAVRGSTADLVRWVTGRGAVELEADGGELPRLGRWL